MSDNISRQAAIDALEKGNWGVDWDKALAEAIIKDLPPAQPETTTMTVGRTRGEMTMWYECDNCGEPVGQSDNYCRNCGRKFRKNE